MEIWNELAGWEKLSIICFGVSLTTYLPSIIIRKHNFSKIVLCLLLIIAVSLLAPVLGFGLAAWGFTIAAYIIFGGAMFMPQFIAWRKNGSINNT